MPFFHQGRQDSVSQRLQSRAGGEDGSAAGVAGLVETMKSLRLTELLLVVLGGLFGYLLGKMPVPAIYGVAAAAAVLAILVIGRGR